MLSPNTHTLSAHPTLTRPPIRDQRPRTTSSSHKPSPSWIHTAATAACTGWFSHTRSPQCTTFASQAGLPCAEGATTFSGRPSGMCDWICSAPSSSHSRPKPMRSTRRASGSGMT